MNFNEMMRGHRCPASGLEARPGTYDMIRRLRPASPPGGCTREASAGIVQAVAPSARARDRKLNGGLLLREPVRAEGKKTGQRSPGTLCAGRKSIDRWQVAEDKICFILRRTTR